MKSGKKYGFILGVVLLLGILALNRAELSNEGIEVRSIMPVGNTAADINFMLRIYNPNYLSSTLERLDTKVLVNGRETAHVTMEPAQGIPGRKSTSFPVSIRVPISAKGDTLVLSVYNRIDYRNLGNSGTLHADTSYFQAY